MEQADRFAPAFGGGTDLGKSLALSFGFAIFIGFISTLLTMGAYGYGLLPPGGVLDPLTLIRSSQFSPGTPLLVAWTKPYSSLSNDCCCNDLDQRFGTTGRRTGRHTS